MFSPNTAGGYSAAVLGVAPKNQRKAISDLLESESVAGLFPKDGKFVWAQKPNRNLEDGSITDDYSLYMVKQTADGKARLEGDNVTSAGQGPDPTSGEIKVNLGMSQQGAKILSLIHI